jgi:hypothetical protein
MMTAAVAAVVAVVAVGVRRMTLVETGPTGNLVPLEGEVLAAI